MYLNTRTIAARSSELGALRGFSLMEALIAIALAAIMLAVFTSVLTTTVFLKRAQYSVQASNFIQEQLDSLRAIPYNELLVRTNGNLLGLSQMRGPWRVKTDAAASPPSGMKVFAMETAQAAIVSETGLAVLPGNYMKDSTITAKVRVLSTSPVGWGAGIAFRYIDAENHYRYRITSGGVALDKVRQGTVSTLWSQSVSHGTNTWYTLEVGIVGNVITLKKNGTTLTTHTDTGQAYLSKGVAAIMTTGGSRVYVDDVSIVENAVTTTWNFDAETDGAVPVDWQRYGPSDLPNGAATLTIANYLGDASIREATMNITWVDAGITRSASGTTLITK